MFFIEMLPKVHSCNIVPNVSIRSLRSSALTITEGMDPGFIAVGGRFFLLLPNHPSFPEYI